jgi:MFS family permease
VRRRRPWPLFYGWVVVIGAFLVLFVAYGAQYSFGVFFAALLDEFGWSRASLAGAFSVYAFVYCALGFPAGRFTDRWGPRVVIAWGGVLLGVAMAAMATVTELWQVYLLYGGAAAFGMGTAYIPCNTTVVRWFVRRRGLAAGIASSGGSAGTFVVPPVAHLLVDAAGWRAAYVVFGAAIVVLLSVVARLMRRDPESMGQYPDGDDRPPVHGVAGPPRSAPLGEVTRTLGFWLLAAAFTATWIPVFVPLVHVVPLARDLGFSAAVGASLVSAIGVGAVVGRLLMGAVSDHIGRRTAVAISMALQAVAFAGFALVRELVPLYLVALVFGYSYGAISTLFAPIVGDFFGREQAGGLVGLLFAIAGSTAAWGPLAAGAIYDTTGSYVRAFVLAAAFNLLAVLLVWSASPSPPGTPSSGTCAGGARPT